MPREWDIYRRGGPQALWEHGLGFLDWSVERAMVEQHRNLERQLERLHGSAIGQKIFCGGLPRNADQLRRDVPLTTYEDYASLLAPRIAEAIPGEIHTWVRTSGRTNGEPKWFPVTKDAYEASKALGIGIINLVCARGRGDIRFPPRGRVLNLLAPPPYASGVMFRLLGEIWNTRNLPPTTTEYDEMPFDERMAETFSMGMTEGVDVVVGIASVLAGLGETLADRMSGQPITAAVRKPRATARMGRAMLRARLAGRGVMPKDIWKLRGVLTTGMDSSLFRERIRQTWGQYPLELYGMSEAPFLAVQTWDYTTLTFVPTLNFFEFIPDYELEKELGDPEYRPETRFLDEIEAGKNYEVVITNFNGGPAVRYRTGDIVRIPSLRNDRAGINLPQMAYYSRQTDLIDIAGFVRVTERTIWSALERAGIPYEDWTARKELWDGKPVLHLRVEPKRDIACSREEAEERLHHVLCDLDPDWADMELMAKLTPLRVSYLPHGSFQRYMEIKQAEGADLAHLKPVHMNAIDPVIDALLAAAPDKEPALT